MSGHRHDHGHLPLVVRRESLDNRVFGRVIIGDVTSSPPLCPTLATHYHLAWREPFANLSDLAEPQLERALAELAAEKQSGASARAFGPVYMDLRRRTEAKLRNAFVARGGIAERSAPHYFVLGECAWFQNLSPHMQAVQLSLEDFPAESTSATYPDSVVSMGIGVEYGLPDLPRPYHGHVFFLDEVPGLVEEFGLPNDESGDYGGYAFREFEKFVEVQLWVDDPIIPLIADSRLPRP